MSGTKKKLAFNLIFILVALNFMFLSGLVEARENAYCSNATNNETATVDRSNSTQRTERETRQLQLALARICISESGWQLETWDCRLIFEVLSGRSGTGHLTMGIMRRYSTATFNRRRTDRRRWVPFLNAEFREPRHWQETVTVPWFVYREAYRHTYNYAGYLIRHEPNYPCTMPVHHWGARGWRVRQREREGWRRVECGMVPTRNQFWMVPRLLEPEERVCRPTNRICEPS